MQGIVHRIIDRQRQQARNNEAPQRLGNQAAVYLSYGRSHNVKAQNPYHARDTGVFISLAAMRVTEVTDSDARS